MRRDRSRRQTEHGVTLARYSISENVLRGIHQTSGHFAIVFDGERIRVRDWVHGGVGNLKLNLFSEAHSITTMNEGAEQDQLHAEHFPMHPYHPAPPAPGPPSKRSRTVKDSPGGDGPSSSIAPDPDLEHKRAQARERQRRKRERDRAASGRVTGQDGGTDNPYPSQSQAPPLKAPPAPLSAEEEEKRERIRAAARERQRRHRAGKKAKRGGPDGPAMPEPPPPMPFYPQHQSPLVGPEPHFHLLPTPGATFAATILSAFACTPVLKTHLLTALHMTPEDLASFEGIIAHAWEQWNAQRYPPPHPHPAHASAGPSHPVHHHMPPGPYPPQAGYYPRMVYPDPAAPPGPPPPPPAEAVPPAEQGIDPSLENKAAEGGEDEEDPKGTGEDGDGDGDDPEDLDYPGSS